MDDDPKTGAVQALHARNTSAARDFVGYGRNPPQAPWPNGARLAVSLVLNYEEGSEQSILDGDPVGEAVGEIVRQQERGQRDLAIESMYEYGSRVGVWRLLDIFDRNQADATIFACAVAVERNSEVAAYLRASSHEVCCHGYRWEEVFRLTEDQEREHIALAVRSLENSIGKRPVGWYCRYGPSERTRRLLVETGGFEYDSDSYADDVPYSVTVQDQPWCVLPYALDTGDMKYWRAPSFGDAQDHYNYLVDTFDCLYRESERTSRMMSVGLHCRIAGRPGRAVAIERFIRYARSHEHVWFARRIDIARAWRARTVQI